MATDVAITTATPLGTAISSCDVASSIHMLTMMRKYKNAPITAPTIATMAIAYDSVSTADLITPNFATNPDVNGTPACANNSALKLRASSGLRFARPLNASSDVAVSTASKILQPGYKYKERILRPARVAVTDPEVAAEENVQSE